MGVPITLNLSNSTLRRLLDMLDSGEDSSVDQLVERLILGSPGPRAAVEPLTPPAAERVVDPLLVRPGGNPSAALAESTPAVGQLQFLTNRFSPIKVAARALANLGVEGEWPDLPTFHARAASAARQLGRRLRAEDAEQGRRGMKRRWVAYPVGEDERAALERYVYSFTLFEAEAGPGGPLVQLGLAAIVDGKAALTERGWLFATAASPVLDGVGDSTLSVEEVEILRDAVQGLPAEADAVAEFIRAVHAAAGLQSRVDELLGAWHADWTADRAAAERAALLGRLSDLGLLLVSGRGPTARIELLDANGFERHQEGG